MKYLYLFIAFVFLVESCANGLSITDVKVSVTAESAAVAREKAIEQAHTLAFDKLMKENFPDQIVPIPSGDHLINMVKNFSIDKEKTSPKSYAAVLSFQFDDGQIQSWLQGTTTSMAPSLSTPPSHENNLTSGPQTYSPSINQNNLGSLTIVADYQSHPEWQKIQKTLKQAQGMINVSINNFSAQRATLNLQYNGNLDRLQQYLLAHGYLLTAQDKTWVLESSKGIR